MKLQCLDEFPSHIHPLHVLVNKSHFTQNFPNCNGPTHALLFSSTDDQSSSKRSFIVCAHVTAEDETTVNTHTCLTVYVSRYFLRHYDVKEHSQGSVCPQPLRPLKKIVVGARTKQSFRWASSEKFSSGLLVLTSCHTHTLLARQGDVLLIPYHHSLGDDAVQVQQYMSDVMVLECTPVSQGIITANTSVLVSDCRDMPISTGVDMNCKLSSSSLFVSDFAQYANSLTSSSSLLNSKIMVSSDLSTFIQALECRLDVRVLDVSSLHKPGGILYRLHQMDPLDVDSVIFVNKSLLLKLGVFNGEWVVVSLPSDKVKSYWKSPATQGPDLEECGNLSKTKTCVHLVKIEAFDTVRHSDLDVNDNIGFISPLQWFNLSGGMPVPVGNTTIKIKVKYNNIFVYGSGLPIYAFQTIWQWIKRILHNIH